MRQDSGRALLNEGRHGFYLCLSLSHSFFICEMGVTLAT